MTQWEQKFIEINYNDFEKMINRAFKIVESYNLSVYLWYDDLIQSAWLRLFSQISNIIQRFGITKDNMNLKKKDEVWRAKFFAYIRILAKNAILLKTQQMTEKDSGYVINKLKANFVNIKSNQDELRNKMLKKLKNTRRNYCLKCRGERIILDLLISMVDEGVDIYHGNKTTLIEYLQSQNEDLAKLKKCSIQQYISHLRHPDVYFEKVKL